MAERQDRSAPTDRVISVHAGAKRWWHHQGLHPRLRHALPGDAQDRRIEGKRIVLTGATSGIGRAAAVRLASRGADLYLIARRVEELEAVRAEIAHAGGAARAYACDLTDSAAVAAAVADVEQRWDRVDVLINNAGRSIRRPLVDSLDRLHDFERTMAINYFATVNLTLRLLPGMLEARRGQIINVGTLGVHTGAMPLFVAYHGSKAAMTAFGRSAGAELRDQGIIITTVHYPLVRTPMMTATAHYREYPRLSPDEAADWLLLAIQRRPVSIHTRNAWMVRAMSAFAPRRTDRRLLARL